MARPKHDPETLEKMEVIKDNLRRLANQYGMNQTEIANKTGLSKSTVSDYFNAKSLISPGNMFLIAEALGVNTEEIYFRKDNSFVNLGLYGDIYCGEGEVHFGHALTTIETPSEWLTEGSEFFWLKANGDSMVGAKIHENDLLLIRRQDVVENGEIAAVIVGDKRMLKRVYKDENKLLLISENPSYPPIEYIPSDGENIRIIGKLKKSVTNFD